MILWDPLCCQKWVQDASAIEWIDNRDGNEHHMVSNFPSSTQNSLEFSVLKYHHHQSQNMVHRVHTRSDLLPYCPGGRYFCVPSVWHVTPHFGNAWSNQTTTETIALPSFLYMEKQADLWCLSHKGKQKDERSLNITLFSPQQLDTTNKAVPLPACHSFVVAGITVA